MFLKNLLVFSLVLLKFHNYSGCDDAPKKGTQPSHKTPESNNADNTPAGYSLTEPQVLKLPSELNEISGITYYAKDSSVFAIIDNDGLLFKIPLKRGATSKYWRFDKKHDFEDIALRDSIFYVLISNGNIEKLHYQDNKFTRSETMFHSEGGINEFETLYYDPNSAKLVMLCKNCAQDKENNKKSVTAFGVHPDSMVYTPGIFKIKVKPVIEKLDLEKLHLKPSAAAVNPVTKELYVLASSNKLLIIMDANGDFKNAYPLDAKVFKQPEGIAFTPSGDMLISNEAAESGSANILIFKYQKQE